MQNGKILLMDADYQILDVPLLSDEERRRQFFKLLPEDYFLKLIGRLRLLCMLIPASAWDMLNIYWQHIDKPTATFDNPILNENIREFNATFSHLAEFVLTNFKKKEDDLVLLPDIKLSNPKAYLEQTKELVRLCEAVDEQYKKMAHMLSAANPASSDKKAAVEFTRKGKSMRVFSYNGRTAKVTSSKKVKMYDALWPSRINRKYKNKKEDEGLPLSTLAVRMDLIESPKDIDSDILEEMKDTIKEANRYLRSKDVNIPAEIQVQDNAAILYIE